MSARDIMVFSEFALGFLTNLIYDSSKKIPEEISDIFSKVYDKAIEEFSNKHYKLNGIQIDTFFHQKNVEIAIKKYLKNPDKLNCSNVLIQEFFELFSEEDFSREDTNLILNTFFETIDAEIEKYPELIVYLDHYLAKITYCEVQETNQGVQELSQDVKEISQTVQEIHKVINEGRKDQNRKELNTDFEESIKKYLNKIIEEEGKNGISEVYTELSAKEILPITLKFRNEENDKTQDFEVIELVEKEEKLIISGESGSGKTTTLRWLNYILAKNYLEGKYENIPLYIELNSYIGEERFIKSPFDAYVTMKASGKRISKETLKTMLEGKATILLDGFDLLSPTDEFYPYDKISNFITDYNKCRFVISSRPGFFESIKSNFKVSELEKLTEEKIEIFINRYISNGEHANILKDRILSNEQLKSILSNPMMLYITIKVAMERKNRSGDLLPSTRYELYEAFVSTLFSHQEEKGKDLCADSTQIENSLTELYFKLQCRNEISCKYSEALKFVKNSEDFTFGKISPQAVLKDCFKLGLLAKNDYYVSYGIHQSFQEYFAALKLKELFESGFDVSETFSHPKWEEVVIFTSEMLGSDFIDEFVGSMLLKGELFLASKCVNKASEKIKEKLCALLADKMDSRYELEKRNSIESLGRIGNVGICIIIEALKDEDEDVRWRAAEALGNIKSDTAVQPLINALKDENYNVRWRAAKALGNIKSDTAVQPLINALKDENYNVRWRAAEALGNIKSDTAVQLLINALKDEDYFVRENAAEALGNIKSDTAVQPLINALKDEDEDVRWRAAKALGNIKSDTAVQPLINALKDEDSDVRGRAAEALGNIKSDTAVQPLINALKDEDSDVRGRAAEALGNIKSDTAVQPLINALKDEDEYVRWGAAEALGNICTVKNKMQLEDLLESDYEFSVNTAFGILHEIEKEEKSKLILFKDLKKRSKMTPKYSIFVSSVQKELENERVTIQDLVGSDPFLSEYYTSLLYEYEPAYPEKTLEGCLNTINRCQVYLLIVGMK
ncbi:HEAT repeat domain-containing protein [Methanosarcina sp.]|uniref:HEAT repeat domain-containing protein n=1 Tax=Methanosarcina sp. TaxID=2213 RepID=UPI002ABCE12A|nr:HEAT repeat domain-containing protein [Methanosarcina sp.]MDY9925929.1 HEAT repeat domain-containing protein [Methanosarcina sp.]